MPDETAGDFAQGEAPVAARQPTGRWSPIVDWADVFPGNRGVDRHGTYDLFDAPAGVELEIEVCRKSEPLIVAEQEWEGMGQLVPLAYWTADGSHHLLYRAYDRRHKIDKAAMALGGATTCSCYAVSDDAFHWTKPQLGYVDYQGSTANNIIPTDIAGTPFEDPSAPEQERFRVMGQEGHNYDPATGEVLTSEEAGRRFRTQEQDPAYAGPRVASKHWIFGWTSPNGIHWTALPEPVADMPSDGGNAAQYDPETGTYFAYIRKGAMSRRAIGLTRTKDFWHWPEPQLVLAPDPQDDPEISFYGTNYFRYPDRPDLHGMFLMIYHQRTDHMDNQMAFSRDMLYWHRPQRRANIPVGPPGSGEEGIIRVAQTGLTILPDGRWACLYEGNAMLHNASGFMTVPPGQLRWAMWDPHRLTGITAAHEGRFTIPTVKRSAGQLRLNYRCGFGGHIEVELIPRVPSRVNPDAQAIPGFSFKDCDRLYGDQLDQPVSWKGTSDVGALGEVAIPVRMFQSKLFAYSL